MLVLTRKTDQQICVGGDITITIVRIEGRAVRIGIDAPRDVSVRRSELTTGLTSPRQPLARRLRRSDLVRPS